MDFIRDYVSEHFEHKNWFPDIICLLKALVSTKVDGRCWAMGVCGVFKFEFYTSVRTNSLYSLKGYIAEKF
jgi:hypothetical protein